MKCFCREAHAQHVQWFAKRLNEHDEYVRVMCRLTGRQARFFDLPPDMFMRSEKEFVAACNFPEECPRRSELAPREQGRAQ